MQPMKAVAGGPRIFERALAVLCAALCVLALSSAARAQDDPPLVYKVQKGDTLYKLGARYFVGRDAVVRVQRLNRVTDPHRLQIGSTLRVPRELARYEQIALRVQYFSGPVRIGGNPATVGAVLAEGSEVRTGANGFVSLRSGDGSLITMPSSSHARLLRARRYLLGQTLDVDFEVLGGRGEAEANKLREQERFRLRTPVAVTAVRGTVFRVAHDEPAGRSVTEVVEGAVEVASDGQTGVTGAGFGIAVSAAGLGTAEALLPPPVLEEPGAIQTAERLRFYATLPPGSVGYRTQIARDVTFTDIVAEQVETSTPAEFGSLADGRYSVRARAISGQGIEGLSDGYSFRRKRLGVTPSVARSPLADGFLFSWEAAGEGQSYFALQLWHQDAPETLLVDETGLDGRGMVLTDLAPGSYAWRVAVIQAESEDGLLKVWAPVQKLNVTD